MPDDQATIPLYNLENAVRALGAQENSYVISIFDCCREPYNQSKFKPVAMRSGVGNEEEKVDIEDSNNVFLIFGCPPQKEVPGESLIVP